MKGFFKKAIAAISFFAVAAFAGFAMNKSAGADLHDFDEHHHESIVCDEHGCDLVAEDSHFDKESSAILVARKYDRPCEACDQSGKCSVCKGTGKCRWCKGKGKYSGNKCYVCNGKKKCSTCKGDKKCFECKGKGHYVH